MTVIKPATAPVNTLVNVVHSEEIWKEHVRHETNSQLRIWPARWGFLVPEYNRLDRIVRGEKVSPRSPTAPKTEGHTDFTLPPIQQVKPLEAADRYPLTTTRQIGWKSAKKGNIMDFYESAFNSKSRNLFALPKLTLLDSAAS